jgi:hypothetical protein
MGVGKGGGCDLDGTRCYDDGRRLGDNADGFVFAVPYGMVGGAAASAGRVALGPR